MKKYFPILIMIMVISMFFGGRFVFDFIAAKPVGLEKDLYAHYQTLFKEINVDTIDQRNISLTKVKAPIVILNFWASWCSPCLAEMPSLVKLKDEFSDDEILILGINSDEDNYLEKINKIREKYAINFPMVADPEGNIFNKFLISKIPLGLIFYKGTILEVGKGSKNYHDKKLVSKLKELVRKN